MGWVAGISRYWLAEYVFLEKNFGLPSFQGVVHQQRSTSPASDQSSRMQTFPHQPTSAQSTRSEAVQGGLKLRLRY